MNSSHIASRIALKYLMRYAGALQNVQHLRFQAVFMMGAGGSGKGYVGERWMKYMPGGGPSGSHLKELFDRKLTEEERGLSNLNFERAVQALRAKKIDIELVPGGGSARIPFKLYTYDQHNNKTEVPEHEWRDRLPPIIYKEVEGLVHTIFKTPVHELPSYWRQVNPDIYKQELAGYLETEPGYVHEMSSTMSKAYFEAILETGDPLFVDGTGADAAKMDAQIKAAKAAGYYISIVLVIVPLTVNQIRNATRERNVDPMVLVDQWKKIVNSFDTIKGLADKTHVIVNRNDEVDIKKYREQGQKIDDFIASKTNYSSLLELIQHNAPEEAAQWGSMLKPHDESTGNEFDPQTIVKNWKHLVKPGRLDAFNEFVQKKTRYPSLEALLKALAPHELTEYNRFFPKKR